MKKLNLLLVQLCMITLMNAQNFTWVKGSSTAGALAVYGTQGVSAAANTPGGRHGCAKWVDAAGNLWLFGGEGPSSSWWNDLWKYNISTNEWTWVRGSNTPNMQGAFGTMGVTSSTNEPGSREFPACWTDAAGNFWMFGGDGYASTSTFGRLGDLWKYNPTTNQWTWMHGFNLIAQNGIYGTAGTPAPTNAPGSRYGAGVWTDPSGDFWLYAGRGLGAVGVQGYLNDLWRYNVATNQWTWISGSNATGQYGIYGTMGTAAPANAPGGRFFPACWIDGTGNLYMFGGLGFAATLVNDLSDLWKYSPSTNTWTWLSGSNGIDGTGVYGTQNVSSPLNIPGSRFSSAYWKDASGNFWMFGGIGYASVNPGELNDLFRYNPNTSEWTWVKGSNLEDQNGTYGTQGVAAPSNMPGAREYNTFWKDLTGKFWLFGGEGYDISSTATNHMNDMWTFSIPCAPDSITSAPGKVVCSGASATLTAVNGGLSTIWYPTAASTASISGGASLTVSSLTTIGVPVVYSYYAEANSCTAGPRASVSITVNPLPTLTVTATHSMICKGETNTLTVSGANSYLWNTTPTHTTTSIVISPTANITYSVTGTGVNNCASSVSHIVNVNACLGIKETEQDIRYLVYPNPNKGAFTLVIPEPEANTQLTIFNALGQKVFEKEITAAQTSVKPELKMGLYYYQLTINGDKAKTGKLVIE